MWFLSNLRSDRWKQWFFVCEDKVELFNWTLIKMQLKVVLEHEPSCLFRPAVPPSIFWSGTYPGNFFRFALNTFQPCLGRISIESTKLNNKVKCVKGCIYHFNNVVVWLELIFNWFNSLELFDNKEEDDNKSLYRLRFDARVVGIIIWDLSWKVTHYKHPPHLVHQYIK